MAGIWQSCCFRWWTVALFSVWCSTMVPKVIEIIRVAIQVVIYLFRLWKLLLSLLELCEGLERTDCSVLALLVVLLVRLRQLWHRDRRVSPRIRIQILQHDPVSRWLVVARCHRGQAHCIRRDTSTVPPLDLRACFGGSMLHGCELAERVTLTSVAHHLAVFATRYSRLVLVSNVSVITAILAVDHQVLARLQLLFGVRLRGVRHILSRGSAVASTCQLRSLCS